MMGERAVGSSSGARAGIWGLWRIFAASKAALAFSLVAGLLAGSASAGVVALINGSLAGAQGGDSGASAFFGLCLLTLFMSSLSVTLLSRIAQENQYELRMWLARRILSAPLRHLQSCGPHRLMAALTEDVGSIVAAQEILPGLFVEGAKLLGAFAYLAYLSPSLFALVVLFVLFGVGSYRLAQKRAMRWFELARDADDILFGHLRALTEGYKELKMDARRRSAFLDVDLNDAALLLKERLNKAGVISVLANNWSESLYYVLIGVILFVAPGVIETPRAALTGFTLAILFIGGPLSLVFNAAPLIGKAMAALGNIEALGLDDLERPDTVGEPVAQQRGARPLELRDVSYRHDDERGDGGYPIGPVDLTLRPGELVFITGGNGSGKTTLAMVMLGLYLPQSGELRLGGERITNENREAYRQNFSVVFADSFVFDSLLGYDVERAQQLLVALKLDRKLHIVDGRFSTVDLSRGERKRLALLAAYLSDRPFYLFDEWAADQDPLFRDVFYRHMLPELKARGKTVIVITHDDRYFHLCDRLLRLTTGQVEELGPRTKGLKVVTLRGVQ
jgi:putative pyoverdin transport system ATP-binding/permease protein